MIISLMVISTAISLIVGTFFYGKKSGSRDQRAKDMKNMINNNKEIKVRQNARALDPIATVKQRMLHFIRK